MDRPSQEPASRPEGAESPLNFPVEAPRPADGGGSESPLDFPVEAPRPPDGGGSESLLDFPVEASRPPDIGPPLAAESFAPGGSGSGPAAQLFPAEPPGPADAAPLPFPVAELPGLPAGPPPQPGAPYQHGVPYPAGPPGQSSFAGPLQPGVPHSAGAPGQSPFAGPHHPGAPRFAGQPTPPPNPPPLLRLLPPALTALAALMALVGTFLPLFRLRQHIGSQRGFLDTDLSLTETAWGSTTELPGQESVDQAGSPFGVPVLVAVVVLAVAAVLASTGAGRGAGRWLIAGGAVFTAGVVATVGMNGLGLSALGGGLDLDVIIAPGMWLLIAAAVVAAAAAVVAHLPLRNAGWADPAVAYADTPTPPSGVAITVLPPDEPDEPDDEPQLR